jgi:hypothetical protein
MQNRISKIYILIFTLLAGSASAITTLPGHGSKDSYTRFGIAPVVGFYDLQTQHAIAPKPRMSFSAFAKNEWSMDHSNQTFFSIGIEYLVHGLNYKSYYFDQDTLQLYDKSFGYDYSMYIQEANLPVQLKYTFNSTTNSLFTPYVSIGYHLRYLVSTGLKVQQDGALIKSDHVDMKFKNPFITDKINSFGSLSLGFQNHRTRSNSATFFVELSYRYGFSPYYFKESYSANAVYIRSSHLALNIGVGF